MELEYEVIFYRKPNGSIPVRDFITGLPCNLRAKAARDLELLQSYGRELRMPYSKYIQDGVFELRIQLANDIARVFYFFYSGRKIIVTNGYVKKAQKLSRRELKRALEYKKDWEERSAHGE